MIDAITSPKIYDEPFCGCHQSGASLMVAQLVGKAYAQAISQLQVCKGSQRVALECTLIQLITTTVLSGTIIESGSQEALWETEAFLKGTEERVLARVRDYYAESVKLKMTDEEARQVQQKLFSSFGFTQK